MRQREKHKKYINERIPLEQIDIREVLDDLNICYTESGKNVSNGWIGVTCPFCGDDSNHLGICLNTPVISCFKCGITGTIIKYLAEELHSYSKAKEILSNSIPREMKFFEKQKQEHAINVKLPQDASKQITKAHAEYLKNRNYDYQYLTKKYNLYFCGPTSYWMNRIIVPITKRNKLITFTSIDIASNSFLRYRHLSDEKSIISIKHCLFGLEFIKNNTTCCLVEGIFDQFRIGDGAVCGFGIKITPEQKQLLTKFNKIVIAFDGDAPGRQGAEEIANDISVFSDVEILDLPDGIDPDKLNKEDIRYIRNKIGRD